METSLIKELQKKGVQIPNPESVFIANDVDPDRISSENVTLYAGTKLIGQRTLIQKNVTLGLEAPVCLENTLVGKNSELRGGYFNNAVFLGDNVFGSGAHVRSGTILEEQANAAHTVGLKQTILFPFVTLGSLINFCDCFMAGGTSRKDHSEVGSSFIHFNYTPNQDKATPSMMGDIHQGVMLDSKPIFLGGQGGLVGPVRINYGCITAAGSIIRKNQLEEDRLILGGALKEMSLPRQHDVYTNVTHIHNNNIFYISGLLALKRWYHYIRPLFCQDASDRWLIQGLQENLDQCIQERLKRFKAFGDKLEGSKTILSNKPNPSEKLIQAHSKALKIKNKAVSLFNEQFNTIKVSESGQNFIDLIKGKRGTHDYNYIATINGLDKTEQEQGSEWLLKIQHHLIDNLSI